ncbi:MAG: TIGR02757 family protein [Euryarchaeota archaeon]|nr:TIGR02757 family protein [Euryarchaeota archaeon]
MATTRDYLESLHRGFDFPAAIARDPIRFPLRYTDPRDREVAAFLASSLALGRLRSLTDKVEMVMAEVGPHPARFIRGFNPEGLAFAGFQHRWYRPEDIRRLAHLLQAALDRHGSLRDLFLEGIRPSDETTRPPLTRFVAGLRSLDTCPPSRRDQIFWSLLPSPQGGSACKRLHLFLRWMARRDPPDLGLWREVSPSQLMVPLDVHMHRVCRRLRFTRRRAADGKTVEEVTRRFRAIEPGDPVKYDFVLVHGEMASGVHPRRGRAEGI